VDVVQPPPILRITSPVYGGGGAEGVGGGNFQASNENIRQCENSARLDPGVRRDERVEKRVQIGKGKNWLRGDGRMLFRIRDDAYWLRAR
jgi:hypothetical protein